jgi:hypothetical protein
MLWLLMCVMLQGVRIANSNVQRVRAPGWVWEFAGANWDMRAWMDIIPQLLQDLKRGAAAMLVGDRICVCSNEIGPAWSAGR